MNDDFGLYPREEPFDPFSVMLFKALQVIAFLFFIALLAIRPEATDGKIDSKAEFIITMDWPDNHPDDLDMFVQDPVGNIAWYRHRSNNQLLPDSFPITGTPATLHNRPVVVQNSGWEFNLLSKNIDTLELWHVEDINFHQSLIDRLMNTGDITILSHDDTTPRLHLNGVPNPRPLFENLKQRIIAVKRQRGVIKMDTGN